MERKRQQCCLAIAGVLVLAAGLFTLNIWLVAQRSAAMQTFQVVACKFLWRAGVGALLLGIFASIILAACSRNRCGLCAVAGFAMFGCCASGASGSWLLMRVIGDSTRLRRACVEISTLDTSNITEDSTAPSVAADAAYRSMSEALTVCRQSQPLALRLDACPEATDLQGQPWRSNAYRALFRSAEDSYACSGFCKEGASLFALPEGAVFKDNRMQLRTPCLEPIMAEVLARSQLASATLFADALLLLGPLLGACWLGCAPPPTRRPGYVHRLEELAWKQVPNDLPQDGYDSDGNQTDLEPLLTTER